MAQFKFKIGDRVTCGKMRGEIVDTPHSNSADPTCYCIAVLPYSWQAYRTEAQLTLDTATEE